MPRPITSMWLPPPGSGAARAVEGTLTVDVRIGVTYSPREIEVQLPDDADRDELRRRVEDVLAGDEGVLWLTDRKGRDVGVPAKRIAFVEIGTSGEGRTFGFSS